MVNHKCVSRDAMGKGLYIFGQVAMVVGIKITVTVMDILIQFIQYQSHRHQNGNKSLGTLNHVLQQLHLHTAVVIKAKNKYSPLI